METFFGTVAAVVIGVWVAGRLSRRSPNHPINSVPRILATYQPAQPAATNGSWQETAQIPGSLVAGEGGGE